MYLLLHAASRLISFLALKLNRLNSSACAFVHRYPLLVSFSPCLVHLGWPVWFLQEICLEFEQSFFGIPNKPHLWLLRRRTSALAITPISALGARWKYNWATAITTCKKTSGWLDAIRKVQSCFTASEQKMRKSVSALKKSIRQPLLLWADGVAAADPLGEKQLLKWISLEVSIINSSVSLLVYAGMMKRHICKAEWEN